ncbi:DNA cytosine methyltransferase [Desulfovibrio aminophilus]|uniref:DNA cytosine methyltransferase n=1 Tax=Desulfovibrio aminophilus TaxID=81425 RepID=UPI000413D397|nr:DNA cytosine methyltransferase [Desulfovibrio aminophilus]
MTSLVIDLFAGGGGASEGIRMALGRDPDAAVNHDHLAVAMHKANHPGTTHYRQDVWEVSPSWVTRGRRVGLLWASPDCTHFSKAKGGAPRRDQKRRDLAWVVEKWAREVRPNLILLENVEEFRTWGPLDHEGRPIKAAEGETFRAWVRSLRRLGYAVQFRELRACDYGAPTIRKRLFMVARRDGLPIVWPEPTHGDPKSAAVLSGTLLPWRTAAECIDWSIPCPSIFERKRPLAENTLRRIAEGIRRYVLGKAEPFIVGIDNAGAWNAVWPSEAPLSTVITKAKHCLVVPTLVTNTTGHAPSPADAPVSTLTTGQQQMLASACLVGAGGPSYGGKPADADKPFNTLMTENHTALVSAFLAGCGGRAGQSRPRGSDEPMATVTAKGDTAVVAAHLQRDFGNSVGQDARAPLGTITAGGGGKASVVTSHLVKLRGTCKAGQPVREPMPTVTAGGLHVGEVRAFLVKYYGEGGQWQSPGDPMHTIPTKDRMGLVTVMVQGQPYVIADIGMRMLQPRELYRAQGFPDSYVIDLEHEGRALSKSDQVRLCGNSVCPPMAAALVRANYAEAIHESRDPLPLLAMGGE